MSIPGPPLLLAAPRYAALPQGAALRSGMNGKSFLGDVRGEGRIRGIALTVRTGQ